MPKLKTKSGAKKRFKVTATGKVMLPEPSPRVAPHFHLGSAGSRFRQGPGIERDAEAGDAPVEPPGPKKGPKPWRALFIPIHACAGAAAE